MPKYLLKASSAAPDCNEFIEVGEVWMDGYRVAGKSLNRHPIRIYKGLGGRLEADMRYESYHRLDRRQLKLDTVEMIEDGCSGLSTSRKLDDALCLIYDTDRPWSDRDPVLVMDDGSKVPILATKARPAAPQPASTQAQQSQGSHSGHMPTAQMMGQIQSVMQSITGAPVPVASIDPNDPNAVAQPIGGIPMQIQGVLTDLTEDECDLLNDLIETHGFDAAALKADLDILAGGSCNTIQELQHALHIYQSQ